MSAWEGSVWQQAREEAAAAVVKPLTVSSTVAPLSIAFGTDVNTTPLTRDDFASLIRRAKEAFDKLTPDEQEAHRREQAISFAYGNLKLSGIDVTKEQVAAAYDRVTRIECQECGFEAAIGTNKCSCPDTSACTVRIPTCIYCADKTFR